MNETLKPTSLPEDLQAALYVVLERIRRAYFVDLMVPDDLLDHALETVRCHLVGITQTHEPITLIESQVRGEGWSL